MQQQSRDDADEQYRIDLTPLYESAEAWERALDDLRDDVDSGPPSADELADPDGLDAALDRYESVVERSQALGVHSQLRTALDTGDDDWRRRREAYKSVSAEVADYTAGVQQALADLGAAQVVETAEGAGRDEYDRFLRDAIAATEHRREAGVEELLNDLADQLTTPVGTTRAATTEDFDPPTIETPAGDREVTMSALRDLGTHPDRSVRRRAREAFLEELSRYEHTIATAYAGKVRKHVLLAAERGYDSVRAKALTSESYPNTGLRTSFAPSSHEATLDALREGLDPYHRYLRRRRELLGVDTLRPWDLNAPLAEPDAPEIPYEEACEHVLAAVEPLGDDYRDRLAAYLDDRRVDVYPGPDKREDIPAYAPATSTEGSFLFVNYDATVRTAFYLAHELGHAMTQSLVSESRETVYATVPRPTSEVPSIVHEVLLAEHLLESGDEALAAHVRDRYFDFATGNLYGAGRGAAFKHACYAAGQEAATLTVEEIRDAYRETTEQFLPMVEPGEYGEQAWLRAGFTRDPYASYQYVLGAAGALAVAGRLRDGDLDPGTYRETLSLGGSVPSLEWFERLGLDARDGGMVGEATRRFDDLVDRLLT